MTQDVYARAKELQGRMERYSRAIHYMKMDVKPFSARMNLMTDEIFNSPDIGGDGESKLFESIIQAIQNQYEDCQNRFSSL